jgi:hypothetical protein
MRLVVEDGNGDRAELMGWLLGTGTSRKPRHRHRHRDGTRVPQQGCAACRWTEMEVYREDTRSACTPRYLVVKHGMSSVPGEVRLTSFRWAVGPYEALSAASTRAEELRSGGTGRTLTGPALAALSQAAAVDLGIRDALSRPIPG